MGRLPNTTPQYDHHQASETIEGTPPPPLDAGENLYEPSVDYQMTDKNIRPQSSSLQQDNPQSSPPSGQDYYDMPRTFPPSQEEILQQFPPSQDQIPQPFPPSQPSGANNHQYQNFQHQPNVGMQPFPPSQPSGANNQQYQNFQHQPNVGMQQQFPQQQQPAFYHQPAAGVQMGHPGVVMASPSSFQNQIPNQDWKSDLFGCMEDPENALITACFPCVTFGQIAEIVDAGNTPCATSGMLYGLIAYCIAMPCLISCGYRTKMRARYGLIESPAPDWMVHCFCEWCALCQEYRELKARDIDPSIGWLGNVAKQQQKQQSAMATPVHQRMV